MKLKIVAVFCIASVLLPVPASAGQREEVCVRQAAIIYKHNPDLLLAIAKHESGMNPRITHQNNDGSWDIGLMQINDGWLPTLRKFGITRDMLFDPCVNARVGAWVLWENTKRHGATWKAVGAYNAKSPEKQKIYIAKIWKQLSQRRAS